MGLDNGKENTVQVRHEDGGPNVFGEMVGQNADVGGFPAEDISDDHDSDVFVLGRAYDIDIYITQLVFFTLGLAVPSEAGDAALRHDAVDVNRE